MSSCQPTNSVKALKEEQLKQWPKLIFSAIGLLVEEALLLRIPQLCEANIKCTPYSCHCCLSTQAPSKEGSPYSITERRVPELIPVLVSQPAGDVNHKPGGRLPLLSARPAAIPVTLKRAATSFAAW